MAATKSRPKSAAKKAKPAPSKVKKASGKKSVAKKASKKPSAVSKKSGASKKSVAAKSAKAKQARDVLDFSGFPAGSVSRQDVTLCLACIFRLFTNQLGLAPRTAYDEIRRYSPTVEELTAREPQRPFFKSSDARCPYCDAARRWHAPVSVYRVEGVKAADSARRALVKNLPTKDGRVQLDEQKKTSKQVFFEWLERLGQELDFADEGAWLRDAARGYLQRREPKTDWAAVFEGARAVRRSQRLGEGFERDGARLFLAPALYNDVLLVQYLVSRSQAHGGVTSE